MDNPIHLEVIRVFREAGRELDDKLVAECTPLIPSLGD